METDSMDPKAKTFLSRWPLLELNGDVLYRVFVDRQGNPKTHQLIPPV